MTVAGIVTARLFRNALPNPPASSAELVVLERPLPGAERVREAPSTSRVVSTSVSGRNDVIEDADGRDQPEHDDHERP